MNTIGKKMSLALLAATASVTIAPFAQAQVAGIATYDASIAILNSKARVAAYTQVDSTFGAFYQQIQQKAKEGNDLEQQLYKQFDANGDKAVDDAELAKLDAAKSPLKDQIAAKNSEIQQLQVPIVKARMFALEEITKKFNDAQKQVVAAKKITLILTRDAIIYAPSAVDVTADMTAALDRLVPAVSTTPSDANWQPNQEIQQLYKAIGQILQIQEYQAAAQARQQQAAQPGQPAQPVGQPQNPEDGR